MAIYICSDIHGQYGLYRKMLEDIGLTDSDVLYVLGDSIDRGPESVPLLQDILSAKNVALLLGNHELMMYDYYVRYSISGASWMLQGNGGRDTDKAFMRLPDAEREKILHAVEGLLLQAEVTVEGTTFLLSHSSFLHDRGTVYFRDAGEQEAFRVVWYSPWRMWEYEPPEAYAADGRVHVIGHVPVQRFMTDGEPVAYVDPKHRIVNIDLGCAMIGDRRSRTRGRLCCMCLDRFVAGDREHAFRYYTSD